MWGAFENMMLNLRHTNTIVIIIWKLFYFDHQSKFICGDMLKLFYHPPLFMFTVVFEQKKISVGRSVGYKKK